LERCCHAEDMGGIMRHVYIIETGNGHKKIGVATDMNQRMQQLKTGISTGIKSVLFTDKFHNAIAIETMLKKANKSINLTGEWFDGDLDLCGIEFKHYQSNAKFIGNYHNINISGIVDVLGTKNISGNALKLFFFFVERIDINNQVITDNDFKLSASSTLNVLIRTIDNIVSELVNSGLIKRRVQNTYIVSNDIVKYGLRTEK
jgi:hypothetical protein